MTPDLSSTLCIGGLEILKTLQFDLGQYIEFRQSGSLKAISTEEEYAFICEEVKELTSEGQQVELLTVRDARSIDLLSGRSGCSFKKGKANKSFSCRMSTHVFRWA